MTDHLDEPRELSEQRLMNEGADAERRLGEAARGAVAALRILEDCAAVLVLRQSAYDYFERTQEGRVSGYVDARGALALAVRGRLQHLLAPYIEPADPVDAAAAEAELWELGEDPAQ